MFIKFKNTLFKKFVFKNAIKVFEVEKPLHLSLRASSTVYKT